MSKSKSKISLGTKAWSDRINATWRLSIENILNVGKLLLEAKAALPAGDFKNMTANELDFHQTTASRLMLVAQDQRLYAHVHKLPPHWGTLYELTKLTDEEFNRALETGVITPEMERADLPREPRNLSARPPRPKVIEGTATEVEPESLPIPETPQPAPTPPGAEQAASQPPVAPERISESREHIQAVEKVKDLQRELIQLQAENKKLREEPEPEVQPFGSGDSFTVTFLRNRPDVNFWQGLLVALDQWAAIGDLAATMPNAETEAALRKYDLDRFATDLGALNRHLLEARSAA